MGVEVNGYHSEICMSIVQLQVISTLVHVSRQQDFGIMGNGGQANYSSAKAGVI